jgi:glutamine amidotransferase
VNVPTNSILTIHRQTVMVHPILDKYYDRDPAHVRSSAFVQANGLVSNEKSPSGPLTPANEHTGSLDMLRKQSRSISPDLKRRSLGRDTSGLPYRTPTNGATQGCVSSRRLPGYQPNSDNHLGRSSLSEERASDSDEPVKPANGNTPKKLSQYFPELAITSHAS